MNTHSNILAAMVAYKRLHDDSDDTYVIRLADTVRGP
jgi:hypothetical protein